MNPNATMNTFGLGGIQLEGRPFMFGGGVSDENLETRVYNLEEDHKKMTCGSGFAARGAKQTRATELEHRLSLERMRLKGN